LCRSDPILKPSDTIKRPWAGKREGSDVLEHIHRVGEVLYSAEGNVDLEALVKDKM
jgi:hypothetical protein